MRKLVQHLVCRPQRRIVISRERLRQILRAEQVSFQRTRTWNESRDPDKDTKLDRIEEVTTRFRDRCFAFDQFGTLSIRPCHGSTWTPESKPTRLPATYTRTHGIRCLHGCYSRGDDQLWGVTRRRKGADHMGASNHPNHPALALRLHDYLRWRNTNARHPDALTAQRRERARIRSERQHRWGRPAA